MCTSPLLIKNPNCLLGLHDGLAKSLKGITNTIKHPQSGFKDYLSQYIYVPCGKCPECLNSKQNDIIQRVSFEQLTSYEFFCTLTVKPGFLDSAVLPDSSHYYYLDWSKLDLFFKRLRNKNIFDGPFKYLAVQEFGHETHRPHFHVLFFIPRLGKDILWPYRCVDENFDILSNHQIKSRILDEWYINKGSKRNPQPEPLTEFFTYCGRRNFDFSFVDPKTSQDLAVDFYASKYALKPDDWLNKKLSYLLYMSYNFYSTKDNPYYLAYTRMRPRIYMSHQLGCSDSTRRYIERETLDNICLNYPYPVIHSPADGRTYPLSAYFRKKYLPARWYDDMLLYYQRNNMPLATFTHNEDKHRQNAINFDKKCKKILEHHIL
ncbi:replication initiator protein [Capybara microvirus Cap3_SP_332]|nr:replication initiator protein [Capybara microvirus Cap3_SP_332]